MYLWLGRPEAWEVEREIDLFYQEGLVRVERKIRPDAQFKKNGKYHFLEVDRTQSMVENKKKLDLYAELDKAIHAQFGYRPIIVFYTTTVHRRDTLKNQCQQLQLNHEIYCKEDLR